MIMFEKREQEIARNRAEGKAEGIAEKTEEDVLGMLNEGFPVETIARAAKIRIADVLAIADRNGVKLP